MSYGNTKIPWLDIGSSKQDGQSHDLTLLNLEQLSCVTDTCTYLESKYYYQVLKWKGILLIMNVFV